MVTDPIKFTILGQPPSKSNSYRVIAIRGHASIGKTAALKKYEDSFWMQCPARGAMVKGRFALSVDIYFASDLPDLDNALKVILDCLQSCGVVQNDRKCSDIKARKLIDKTNPRVDITITQLI